MTEDDKDLLKRLLDDELLSLKTVEETGNRLKELIAENERLWVLLDDAAYLYQAFGEMVCIYDISDKEAVPLLDFLNALQDNI